MNPDGTDISDEVLAVRPAFHIRIGKRLEQHVQEPPVSRTEFPERIWGQALCIVVMHMVANLD